MSRAQQNQVFNQATGNATQQQTNAQGAFGTASAGYNAELANPGYDAATKTAITTSANDANNAGYDTAAGKALNKVAATRNDAGTNELLDSLARGRAQTGASAAAGAQEQIGNAAIQGKQNALGGLGSLYGTGSSASNGALNTAGTAAQTPGFWDQFGGAVSKGLGNAVIPGYSKGVGGGTLAFG